jgi:hypothetical protein
VGGILCVAVNDKGSNDRGQAVRDENGLYRAVQRQNVEGDDIGARGIVGLSNGITQ